MITAVFTDNSDYARATGLWQWDYGQRLRIEGLKLPTAIEIHFALTEQSGDAITRVGTTKDSVTEVVIPDSLLENQAAGATYEIYAWIYLADKTSGETIKRISMQVKRRPKPEGFDTPEDAELFREAIEAVNASADRAEMAREGAEAAQKAAEAAAGKIEGEITGAGQIAEQVKRDADAVAKDKQAVSQMVTETTQNAQNAAKAAQAAENSSTAAKQAQEVSERAGERATSAMEATEKDRTEVAENRKAVEQAKKAVAADRRAVENTALQFGQAAQSAINAVGQAQEAAVGAVSAEGQRQTTAVQQAGTQAVSDVTAAKTEAVQAVTTEGDTQTKRVQDAAAGIVADREQISQNKTDIAGLVEGMTDLAPAIHSTASGSVITANDATEGRPFRGLRVFGKSTQDGTPTPEAPIPIVSAGEDGSIEVKVTGKNLLTGRLYYIDYSMGAGFIKNENEVSLPYAPKSETSGIGYVIPCAPEKHYAFSVTNPNENAVVAISEYKTLEDAKNKENAIGFVVPSSASPYKSVYTSKGNGVLVCWIAGKWTDGKTTIHECTESELLQLEIGSEATTYEPPRIPQSLTLATPTGLPGVPVDKDGNYTDQNGQQWVCDEIDLARGKYAQRVLLLKFDSNSPFDLQSINTNNIANFAYGLSKKSRSGSEGICNRLKQSAKLIANETNEGVHISESVIFIRLKTTRASTVEELKQFLANNPTDVLYQIATPIERDLTPEELAAYSSLHAYYPTTVITNDAEAHMEATYVADTGKYIQNMEERLNAKLVNIQSALISQKISGGGIKVTDSSRVPVVRFVMWGKTEQMRTTGAQLLRNDLSKKKTFKGITIELNNCMVSYKGTFVDNGTQDRPVLDLLLKKDDFIGKTLFLVSDDSKLYQTFRINRINGEHEYDVKEPIVDETVKEIYARFFYRMTNPPSGTVINETHKVMLCESKNKEKPWEPYTGGFPSPSPDWEQPIEITDQPVTVTIKGGTEQQSITLTPPKSMTKWDKLEKVDEVWCWVYQSKVLSGAEIKENFMGIHSSGSVMINISTLGVMDEQNDAVSDKFIYSTRSVATLKNGEFRIVYGNAYLKIDGVATAEEGKQWLESNDITIIAQASAPEFNPLSPSEQAQLNALTMYAPETEVTNTGGCNMELTYTVDTKSYVDSKIAAISAAVLEV